GHGDGTFAAASQYTADSDPLAIVAADLDGDSVPDLAVMNSSTDDVSVLLNQGDGTFEAGIPLVSAPNSPTAIAAADLDGDGENDVIAADVGSELMVWRNAGGGKFHSPANIPLGSKASGVAVADFDGDGSIDIAAPNSGAGAVSVLLNKGDGSFQARVDYTTGTGP